MAELRGLLVGCGYFGRHQLEGWRRVSGGRIAAVCDLDRERAIEAGRAFGVPAAYGSAEEAVAAESFDFVDVVTRPEGREAVLEAAARAGCAILCQKPFGRDLSEARARVELVERFGVPLGVNENFRHAAWIRALKREIDAGRLGTVHSARFEVRRADGLGPAPYPHQPYFKEMPRLLIHETLVHHLDMTRFLFGEIERVSARVRRVNPVIAGEDWAFLALRTADGVEVTIDANRVSPPAAHATVPADPPEGARRPYPGNLPFGRMEVLGGSAVASVAPPGRVVIIDVPDGEASELPVELGGRDMAEICRAALQHFIDCLRAGVPTETSGRAYLGTVAAVEAAYRSAAEERPVAVSELPG